MRYTRQHRVAVVHARQDQCRNCLFCKSSQLAQSWQMTISTTFEMYVRTFSSESNCQPISRVHSDGLITTDSIWRRTSSCSSRLRPVFDPKAVPVSSLHLRSSQWKCLCGMPTSSQTLYRRRRKSTERRSLAYQSTVQYIWTAATGQWLLFGLTGRLLVTL